MFSIRTATSSAALALVALGLVSCAQETPPPESAAPTPTVSATPTPTPRSSADLNWPDTERPDQVGSVRIEPQDGVFSSASISGPAVVETGRTLLVTGECIGTRMEYELRTATVGEDQRMILGGTIVCGDTPVSNSLDGVTYSGPVQLAVVEATGVDLGWVQATQELD
jgi:hypothetical protein